MADCCNDKACAIEALRDTQSRTLKLVLAINLAMFLVEGTAGLLASSIALLADALDMLGDALVYGFSLYVVARGARWKAGAALLKGGVMAGFGLWVLGQAVYKLIVPQLPVYEAIGGVGALALAANAVCLGLLWRHRGDDINMRSVWLCSRNDIIANVSVLGAAVGVWLTGSGWPDVAVGLGIAALFLRSAFSVLSEAASDLRHTALAAPAKRAVNYRIAEGAEEMQIRIEGSGGKERGLLQAFGECREGRCTCPTSEYQKLASLEEATGRDSVTLQLRPKAGARLDPAEIEKCLEHTVKQAGGG